MKSETNPGMEGLASLARALLIWYEKQKRAFPWREDATPYRIWVSEIMLQQTRIEAALPYFERFMQALPTISALAQADEERLLKLWEGLGYYSRVRNLQKAAHMVVADFDGELPASYEQLLTLPGIGEYTAGAIASMAFGMPVPAVDGNVLRVMARLLYCDGDIMSTTVKRALREAVCSMLPKDAPGDFNQAIMELGETICLPNTVPFCNQCPLATGCVGHAQGHPEDLPVRAAKKARRVEKRTILVVIADRRVLLHRRAAKGLLAGMWELPGVDGWLTPEQAAVVVHGWGASSEAMMAEKLEDGRHIFSHVEWLMWGIRLDMPMFEAPPEYRWVSTRQLHEEYALPSAFRTYSAHLPQWLSSQD